jgi:hypothetical protein
MEIVWLPGVLVTSKIAFSPDGHVATPFLSRKIHVAHPLIPWHS